MSDEIDIKSDEIDIKGLDKAALLAALYNGSHQQGMGFIHADGRQQMTAKEAQQYLKQVLPSDKRTLYFDYLRGRVLKVDIGGDTLEPWLYDRDNGEGAAASVIEELRRVTT